MLGILFKHRKTAYVKRLLNLAKVWIDSAALPSSYHVLSCDVIRQRCNHNLCHAHEQMIGGSDGVDMRVQSPAGAYGAPAHRQALHINSPVRLMEDVQQMGFLKRKMALECLLTVSISPGLGLVETSRDATVGSQGAVV